MSRPFEPVREDGRPYWQVIYDEISGRLDAGTLNVGDVLPFAVLEGFLGEGVEWRQPLHRAAEQLRESRRRSLESVRGVGYKVIAGTDQVKQAKRQKRRASRALVRTHQHYQTVDRQLLSLDQATKLDLALAGTAVLVGWAKETDSRMAQVEDDLELLKSAKIESNARHRTTEEQMDDLRRRLNELEQQQRTA